MTLTAQSRVATLISDYGIHGILTTKLLSLHDEVPEVERFLGYHPAWFKNDIQEALPSDKKDLLPDRADDFSFYDELEKAPGFLTFTTKDAPALVSCINGTVVCVLTVEYCQLMFHKIEDNANAVHELAALLTARNEHVWFPLPAKLLPDEEAQWDAMGYAFKMLAKENPRKFPALVKSILHGMGYDSSGLKAKDINALVEEMTLDD
jgi:hypothetical protein